MLGVAGPAAGRLRADVARLQDAVGPVEPVNALRTLNVDDVIARAAAALSKACGRPVSLKNIQPLSGPERRNFIARAVAVDDAGDTRSVIVKATRSPEYDPGAENILATSGLVREWVATALVAARAPGRQHGGALLAGDAAAGILVFEDLGAELKSLVDPLLHGNAEEAERALALYATALGRLHADTVACREAHHRTFQSIFGSGRPRHPASSHLENEARLVADRLGHAPPADEMALLSSRLADPGPFLSLVHGDPCPDNALLVDGRIRLVDYEFARPSHALIDGIYWRMGFPTCWCAGRVPDDVAARIDAVYRGQLARAIPSARDDGAYGVELAYVAAISFLMRIDWLLDRALAGDETWGISSIRGRLLWYLEVIINMTAAAHVLPGIRESAKVWLSELRSRWPDATPLGLYPAFVPKSELSCDDPASTQQSRPTR